MKNLFSSLLLMIAFTGILLTSSCKKKETAVPEKTTLQKLQGKWKWVSTVVYSHYADPNKKDEEKITIGNPSYYYDFNTDGNLYIYFPSGKTQFPYALIFYAATGKNAIEYNNGEILNIQTLNDNTLKLYIKKLQPLPDNPNGFLEVTINLAR